MSHLSKHIPVSLHVLGINSRPLLNHHLLAQHFADKLPHLVSTTHELNHLPEKVASVIGLIKAHVTRLQRKFALSSIMYVMMLIMLPLLMDDYETWSAESND